MNEAVGVPEGLAKIEAELLAPGGFFEMTEDDVLGERMAVFANRLPNLREAVVASVGFGDREYLIFSDGDTRRVITFREHERAVASVAAASRGTATASVPATGSRSSRRTARSGS